MATGYHYSLSSLQNHWSSHRLLYLKTPSCNPVAKIVSYLPDPGS